MNYHYIRTRTAKIKNDDNTLLVRMQRKWITHTMLMIIYNGTTALVNSLVVSLKTKHTVIIKSRNCTTGH